MTDRRFHPRLLVGRRSRHWPVAAAALGLIAGLSAVAPSPAAPDAPDASPSGVDLAPPDRRPTTRTAATRPATRPAPARPLRVRDLLPPDPPDPRQEPPTDQEWTEITDFAKANLPNRWAFFEQVEQARGAGNPLVARIKLRITSRYRALMKASAQAPYFYGRAEAQARMEDKAWGAAVDVRRHPKDAAAKSKLHDAVADLVHDVLEARTDRLDNLRELINNEQEQLSHDLAHTDALVDAQVERLTADPLDDDHPRGRWPGGPGGRPFGGPGGPGGGPGGGGMGGGPGGRGPRDWRPTTTPGDPGAP